MPRGRARQAEEAQRRAGANLPAARHRPARFVHSSVGAAHATEELHGGLGGDPRTGRAGLLADRAWLAAIRGARRSVHFENYILHDDDTGQRFAAAFVENARDGVAVRVVYDWLGSLGKASAGFWRRLREGGAEVRCYNPPRLDQPIGWIGRDHRKCLVVDGQVALVTGLCVGRMWEGRPERGLVGWRDTGVEVRGPAVAEVAHAAADTWAATGAPLAPDELAAPGRSAEGDLDLRVVASTPGTAGLYRLDPLVASLARRTLWLTDAYFAGTATYMQALRASAQDVVDVAERRLMAQGGLLLAVLAGVGFVWPRLLAWPLAAFSLWLGLALLARAARQRAATLPPRPGAAATPPPRQ